MAVDHRPGGGFFCVLSGDKNEIGGRARDGGRRCATEVGRACAGEVRCGGKERCLLEETAVFWRITRPFLAQVPHSRHLAGSGQSAVVSGGSRCSSLQGGLPLKGEGWRTCRIRRGAGALHPVWTDAERRQRVPGRQPGEPSVWPQLRSRQARTKRVATSGVRPQCRWT